MDPEDVDSENLNEQKKNLQIRRLCIYRIQCFL